MRLYEYEAKKIFQEMKIPTPTVYGIIHSPEELEKMDIKFPAILKSMVLVGGRGKAGGIKKVSNLSEAMDKATELFKLKIKGYPVETLSIEEVVSEQGACYVGVTMNPQNYTNAVMVSAAGGVEIEEVAKTTPEAILKIEIPDNDLELPKNIAEKLSAFLAKGLNADEKLKTQLKDVISKLYAAYQKYDAKVCEINPLLITDKGAVASIREWLKANEVTP